MSFCGDGELDGEAELDEGGYGKGDCYFLECYSYKFMILDKIYNFCLL